MTRPAHDTDFPITKEMLEEMRKNVSLPGFDIKDAHIEVTKEAYEEMVKVGKNLKREVN